MKALVRDVSDEAERPISAEIAGQAVTVFMSGVGESCAGSPDALPFGDGTFDEVVWSVEAASLGSREGEWSLRELERVVRPGGRYTVRVHGISNVGHRRVIAAVHRAGLAATLRSNGARAETAIVAGSRESGVSADTWATLGRGSSATAWNDSMFRFQRTPYDPRTIAGRIFLRRVRWVAHRIGRQAGARVLEIGCEAGGLLRRLPPGPRVVGLDLSLAALRAAREELGSREVSLVHADATKALPFRDGQFDFVIASEVLEHCRSPRRVVALMHGALRSGGRAIVTIPNERRYLRWKHWLRRFPLTRWMLAGIEEGPAAWHIHHDFDRDKLLWLIDGFFQVETERRILGTTLVFVLRKTGE